MLDIMKRGTVKVGSLIWEYHGDTDNKSLYYITPQPAWITEKGLPKIQIVQYQTSDSLNGSGYCTLQVQLDVPDDVIPAVVADIAQRFQVTNPQFLTLPFQAGTLVSLTLPDGEGGTTGMQVDGTDFGSNAAIFQVPLSADQMKTIKAAMTKQGSSPFELQYSLVVPGLMPAVRADLSFDASIAFQYQVTAHEHTHWASSSTWTYDIAEQLAQSNASKVVVTKMDPNLPQEVVDRVSTWGENVIANLVAKEVQQAIAIQQAAGGTQSFTVNEVSSINQTYQQNEAILWRLRPQVVLPSFADLGLTLAQIDSLQPMVDKRQFVAQVTPQCSFVNSKTPNQAIKAGQDPFMTNIKRLDHVDVTITYPTLTSSATRTHTFTDNTPYTWQADWDTTAGGTYSLSYVAVYEDKTQVKGGVDQIDATAFTLGLKEIGTLNVTFDASRFFVNEASLIDQVTVDFVFNIPQQAPYLETATLTKAKAQATFTSQFPAPLTADYIYTVTYGFVASAKANPYTSDAKRQNGQWVRLEQADFQESFNVFVQMSDAAAGLSVQEADINFFYDGKPYFPDIPASQQLPSPSQSSPIQLNFPTGASTTAAQSQKVWFFANTKVTPLTVVATVLTSDFNQIQIGPFDFSPQSVSLLAVSPLHQFAFIGADPTIVDWTALHGITVHIKQIRYKATGASGEMQYTTNTSSPVQTIRWDSPTNQAYPVHFVVSNLPNGYTDLQFDWAAEYIYSSGTKTASGTESGTSLALPKVATGTEPVTQVAAAKLAPPQSGPSPQQ